MAFDRNHTEQLAIRYVGRGQHEKAIECYIAILRNDNRDVRARQKLAELFLKVGRRGDAFKQLVEVARLHDAGGNPRASLSVYKQLVRLKPSDPELRGALADAYFNAGYKTEAAPHYEQAFEELAKIDADKSLRFGQQLLRIRYDDLPLRLRMARMLMGGGDDAGSYTLYREAIEEYRRRGQMDEVARVARLAMAVKPGDTELLVDAAEACLATDDSAQALEYLREAYAADKSNPRVLDMLARILREGEQPEKARPVLLELARVQREAEDFGAEVKALETALAVGRPSAELSQLLEVARARLLKAQLRLTQLESAAPANDAELKACTRAEVFLRYGFPERAEPELQSALSRAPDSIALMAWAAEIAVVREQPAQAWAYARALSGMVPSGERADVLLRRRVMGDPEAAEGSAPVSAGGAAAPLLDDALVDDALVDDALVDDALVDDELVDDELVDDALVDDALLDDELIDDELADDGLLDDELLDDELLDDELVDDPPTDAAEDVEDEPTAPPSALQRPAIPDLGPSGFDELGDDDGGGGGLFADIFRTGGTFAEVSPDDPLPEEQAPSEAQAPSAEGGVEEARGLLLLGMPQDALAMIEGDESLEAGVLAASCHRELGDAPAALRALRGVLLDAPDDAAVLPDALFAFADLAAREGRRRAALRALLELQDLHADHRAPEVSARVKALRRVLGLS